MKGIVLRASAGTGKTYRLSLEYIARVLSGENYKDILVMTFTKKATSEIRERIIEFLTKISKERDLELIENIKKLHPNLDFTEENIDRVYLEILENQDRLKIYTIDGFINNIFKSVVAPYINIFGYEIIDDTENDDILLKVFSKMVENKSNFNKFRLFLEKKTEKNIVSYLNILNSLINDRWKIMLLNESKITKEQQESTGDIETILNQLIDVFEEVKKAKGNEKPIEDYMSSIFKEVYLKQKGRVEYLIEKWNEFFKVDKCWDGRRVKVGTKKGNVDKEIEIMSEGFKRLQKEIGVKIYNAHILSFEKDILVFLDNLYSIYDNLKFEEKKLTHLDISNYVFRYLDNENINLMKDGKITDYFKELFDSNFSTVFIDEFQDTSILQWRILKGIVGESKNIICVGDEKQSIYGWRGGEKALFENLDKILNIPEENMDVSYRSRQNIVKITNKIFNTVSESYKEKNDEFKTEWKFSDVKSKSEDMGYVEIIESPELEEDETIDMKEVLIDSIETNFNGNYKGIAILARSNTQLREFASILSERKIPFKVESNDSIIFHRAIKPIYELIKYLVLKDKVALLKFLRSDIIQLNNRELKKVIRKISFDDIEIENEKLNNILNLVKELEENIYNKNIVLDIIEKFEISKIYHSKNDLKNIFEFLKISKDFENIVELYNYLKGENITPKIKQISTDENNVITLMSVHKSKGLEFDTVYYYHKKVGGVNFGSTELLIDLKQPFEKLNNYTIVETKYKKVLNILGDDYKFLKELELKDEQEEINVLYVALTRAKKNLFLVSEKSCNEHLRNALDNIIDKKIGEISKEKIEDIKNEEFDKTESTFEIDLKEYKLTEIEEEKNILIDIFTEEKRIIGKAVHDYLELIIKNEENEHVLAKKEIFSKYASIIGEKQLKKILESKNFQNIFKDFKIIFDSKWDYIYPEYEIYYEKEKALKRIDRLMIKKPTEDKIGEILIIDYKTGGVDQEQLDKYIEIIDDHLINLEQREQYVIKGEFLEIKL